MGPWVDWYHRLKAIDKFGFWGSIASIVALILVLIPPVRSAFHRILGKIFRPGVLHITRDKSFNSGWITSAKPEDVEPALRSTSYIVSVEFRSRWWVNIKSNRPARITEVNFKSVVDKRSRETCEFWFLSPDGKREPSAEFQNTAHVEVNLWSFSDRLDEHQSLAGYLVFVDHMGKDYRTEPLLYTRTSLKAYKPRRWRYFC
jgi:hypothetical protein